MQPRDYWFYGFFSLALFLFGVLMNITVIQSNGCSMPIKSDPQLLIQDGKHFAYQEFDELNYPVLSDYVRIRGLNKVHIISPGDILILLGTISLILFGFIAVIKLWKEHKIKKKEEFCYQ